MFRQMSFVAVLAGSAVVLAGCGRGNDLPTEEPPAKTAAPAATQQVTLHVRDMTERQGLT